MSAAKLSALSLGEVVSEREVLLTRESLVRYAAASGDFNPIHYRDDLAEAVGLPGVIAHGMLTMGIAIGSVVDWLGKDAGQISEYRVKFTRPVVVPPSEGVLLGVIARVGELTLSSVRIDLSVTVEEKTVLGKAQLFVRLAT